MNPMRSLIRMVGKDEPAHEPKPLALTEGKVIGADYKISAPPSIVDALMDEGDEDDAALYSEIGGEG